MKKRQFHIPVMPSETIKYLQPKAGGIYVDGTLGGGGHSKLICEKIKSTGKLIAMDQDLDAIESAKKTLDKYKKIIIYRYDNFDNLDIILNALKIKTVNGILLDLGVSTHQLEKTSRGFSFSESVENINSPLDMRMNQSQSFRAADIVNQYHEDELRNLFFYLGEEPYSKNIARKIITHRKQHPINTTNDLLSIIKSATPPSYRYSRKHGHWASKIFRALRMEVNNELPTLEKVIPIAINRLKKSGRLIVISFHSLEDRIVKHSFKKFANQKPPIVKIITKKPVLPSSKEILVNPKAHSAKMRVIKKI